MSGTGQLPISSDSQNIGAMAEKCFVARCPQSWRPQNVGGTDDFGIDYQVLTIESNQAKDMFRIQLKGTTVPELNADGTLFSVTLKASTVRYFSRFTESILLVLCDLSVSPKAIDCPLYYVWIHTELKRVDTRGLPDEQVSVTLHVPKSNVLNDDTNLSQDLEQYRKLAKLGGSLNVTLEKQNPSLDASSRLALLEKIPRGLAERSPALFESLAEEPTSAWPTRPAGSMPWYLFEVDRYLVSADLERAQEMLVQAGHQLRSAQPLEIGEYWHLTGRLHLLNLDQAEACRAFKRATEAAPNNARHLAAWAETEMAFRYSADGPNNFDDIYPLLTSSAPEIQAVKARLLATEKKDEEVEEVLSSFEGSEQLSTKAVFRTMRGRWQEAVEVCDQGLALSDVKQSTRLLFITLKAKAQFHLAVDDEEPPSSHIRLPLTGRPNSNLALLSTAWDGMKAAMDGLRSAGWPANTEFIADVIAAAASILQKEEEALSQLNAAAEKRTSMPVLQASVESLAAQTKKYDVALAANLRQPATATTRLRQAFLLHMMKRDNDCIAFFESHVDSFDADDPMYAESLTAAIISADRLIRTDLVKRWMPLFDATPELIVHRSILTYALDIAKKRNKLEALNDLYKNFNENQRPLGIAIQLFYDFNSHRVDEAEKIVELSPLLIDQRLLPLDAILQLGQAFATLNKWDELLLLVSRERSRFPDNQTLVAVESLALDRLGRTAEARALLSPLVANGATDELILGAYIDIMIRCGFIEEAIQAAENMAAAEKDTAKKRDHLRVLHNLVRANDPSDLRAHDIAWRMGALTDPMDETNEGIFLMSIALSPITGDPDPVELEEYQRRLAEYSERFPHSSVMKVGTVPEDPTPDQLLESIMNALGDTPETLALKQQRREERRQQGMKAPFVWRPQNFFSDIRDVLQLWEISKQAKGSDPQFLLQMVFDQWDAYPWDQMKGHVPLMDMTSLFVAHDLEILDLIFKLFSKVAIPQRTMFYLGRLSDPIVGSNQIEKSRAIQQVLQNNFDQILQPRAVNLDSEERDIEFLQITNEVKSFVSQAPYLLYCDDAIMRVYCKGYEQDLPSICTIDILTAMEKNGLLTAKEVSRKIGMLCSWGVKISIEPGWQIASLPDSILTVKNVADGAKAIREDESSAAIFDGLWNGTGPGFAGIMHHASHLIITMLYQHKMTAMAVASLMVIWHEKAIVKQDVPPDSSMISALLFQTVATLAMYSFPNRNQSGQIWHIYFLLLEHLEGEKLSGDRIATAVEHIAAAAANHDLYVKKAFYPSLKSFLSFSLIDSRKTKQVFTMYYKVWRSFLVSDLQVSTPLFTAIPTVTGQKSQWQNWMGDHIMALPQQLKLDDGRPIWMLLISEEKHLGKQAYSHHWHKAEVRTIPVKWLGKSLNAETQSSSKHADEET
jgi:hypothetical protein